MDPKDPVIDYAVMADEHDGEAVRCDKRADIAAGMGVAPWDIENLRARANEKRSIARLLRLEVAMPSREVLAECIRDLYEVTNGCPLPKYEDDWNAAMEKAVDLLRRMNA